jgi:hypothetical protein
MRFAPATFYAAMLAVAATIPAKAQSRPPAVANPPAAQVSPASQMPPVAFKCPANGIAVEIRVEQQLNDSVSQGPDPSDPTLCRWKRGFTTTEIYFGLVTRSTTEGLPEIRAGFQGLFSGERREFSVRKSSLAINSGRNEYDDIWRRLPNETLTIAGRTMNTIVFENDQRALRMPAVGSQKLWYDLATGMWVKRQVKVQPGTRWGSDWEVVKISQ